MKVLCIADKSLNIILPHMIEAAKRFGSDTEIFSEEFEPKGYSIATEYFAEVERNGPEGQILPDFLNNYRDADIILSFFSPFSAEAFNKLESLKMIGSIRGGYQHINVSEATRLGIAVFNVPGRNAHSVSDFAIGLMLAEGRELHRNASLIMAGKWVDPSFRTHYQPDLIEKTVGIVGLGAIGQLVAKKLKNGWNMTVLGYDPYLSEEQAKLIGVKLVSLEELFAESDFVSVHAKATKDNYHMISHELLSLMKPNAFFINTSRASLVDMKALYEILEDHKIAGAGLDVMEVEPIPSDEPFLKLDNVTITGHYAGNSSDTLANSPHLLVKEMIAVIEEKSQLGLINRDVLSRPRFLDWKRHLNLSVESTN